jgi:hypothetical protein
VVRAHRLEYERYLLEPACEFVKAMGELCVEHYARLAPLQQWLVDLLPA